MAAPGVSDTPLTPYEQVHGKGAINPNLPKPRQPQGSQMNAQSLASAGGYALGRKSSVWDLLNQYEEQSRAASDQQMGLLETTGNQAVRDITMQGDEDLGTLAASLASRGLTNTSVYDSLASRIKEGVSRNVSGVRENVATQKAQFAYHPDPGLYNQAIGLVGAQPQKPNILGQIAPIAGTIIGGVVGGPVGAGIGGAIGGAVGAYANRGSAPLGAYSGQQFGSNFGQYFAPSNARTSPYSAVGPGVTTSDIYTGYGTPTNYGGGGSGSNPYYVPGGLAA